MVASEAVELPPFSEFLAEHKGTVYRFLMAAVGPHEADDAFQETFVSALRAYPRLKDASKLDRRVLLDRLAEGDDHHRAASRRAIPSGDLPERAAPPGGRPEFDGERAAVASLPPKQRVAVVHRHVLDRSYADVADVMGISEEAARANVPGRQEAEELMT